MSEHIRIKTDDDDYVHFMAATDTTLCGLEVSGDRDIGIYPGKPTKQKVDCPDCIQIVAACWRIGKREISAAILAEREKE